MVVDDAVVIEAFADVGSKRAEFGVLRKSEPKRRVFASSEFAKLVGLEQDAIKVFRSFIDGVDRERNAHLKRFSDERQGDVVVLWRNETPLNTLAQLPGHDSHVVFQHGWYLKGDEESHEGILLQFHRAIEMSQMGEAKQKDEYHRSSEMVAEALISMKVVVM